MNSAVHLGFPSIPLHSICAGLANPNLHRPADPSVAHASEVLLAGTGFCLAGVRRFVSGKNARDYNWPGPVYRKLLAAWSQLVRLDIEQQCHPSLIGQTQAVRLSPVQQARSIALGFAFATWDSRPSPT